MPHQTVANLDASFRTERFRLKSLVRVSLLPNYRTAFMNRCLVRTGAMFLTLIASGLTAAQFKFPNQTLTAPDGFEVELIGAPPLVDRPIYGAFDELGRFYVVDSSGSNEKPARQLEEKPHRVVRLEDSDGDGTFDNTIV